jgi:hypothetical protein
MADWSFLTNHARVLLCSVQNPEVRLRDIAAVVDITERSAYAIVTELAEAGYLIENKDGRRTITRFRGTPVCAGPSAASEPSARSWRSSSKPGRADVAHLRTRSVHPHMSPARAWRPWSESAI